MSTAQSIPHLTTRFRIGLGPLLTAVGVLVALAVTITILALTGTHHTTVATPVTASQAASASTPQTRYLGPRQAQAALHGGTTATAGVVNPSSKIQSATQASPSAETGARLDHSGRKAAVAQTTDRLATYPTSARTTLQSVGYYLDAPQQ
jgi:hypothetical protein